MRELFTDELQQVSGAGCSPCPPSEIVRNSKGNNGFGNGADDNLAAPGNSGASGGGKAGSVGDDRGRR